MSNAKQEILARLRSSLDDAPVVPEVPRAYRRTSEKPAAEVLEMLEDRLVDYKANVFHETADSIAGRIATLLGENATFVIPEGLEPSWLPEGDHRKIIVESRDERVGMTLSVRELNDVDAVVTSSTVSCAETGTIFLSGTASEGRRAISLVPDHHICVVPHDSVVELIPEALSRVEPTAPITMISGPSATSDIELERVEGVHGPRRLDVILLG
ncbi:LutC/YkgG family protein [Corynebacterium sp. A21]|uniref:LutC/YkgG family protein n=1 Tax=Corynebacterium sp. A21 TaxID=3457318 RepID=UPI003FD08142